MHKLIYGHVKNNNIKIHYYRTFSQKPTIILLHGMGDYGLCWSRVAYVLGHKFDVLMIDARGHGLSDAPQSGYSDREHASDVVSVIKQLNIMSPILVGHSMGAASAAAAAIESPESINSVILVDPPWRDGDDRINQRVNIQKENDLKGLLDSLRHKTKDQLIELCQNKNPDWHYIDVEHWAKAKPLVRNYVVNGYYQTRAPWISTAGMILNPVLLISSNNKRGGIVTQNVAIAASKHIKKYEHVNIASAGHYIQNDGFDEFIVLVQTYLENRFKNGSSKKTKS